MVEGFESQELAVVLIEKQPEIISAVHSLLTEIKECRLQVYPSIADFTANRQAENPDLIVASHEDNLPVQLQNLREEDPEIYWIVLLPVMQEDLLRNYIQSGANGLSVKNQDFEHDFIGPLKKALVRILERKTFLIQSLSRSSFFAGNRDLENLYLHMKALKPGQIILHYKIIESLGEGGMGEVYRAEDQKLGRQVAIKVLSTRMLSNEIARKRLMREARAASALNHPNIVTVYSIEQSEETAFIVMEFVEGKSLYWMLKRKPLPFSQLLDVGSQIADALAAAHAAGLIHRDMKPGNIMISNTGRAKLLDFGLVKWSPGSTEDSSSDVVLETNLTGIGVPVGTINYMSPEQTRGEALDIRTDIFSLGSVLYEAATGKPPFRGASILDVFHEIATSEPKPPSAINASIPKNFDAVLARAMAKNPEDRFANAEELAAAFKQLKAEIDQPQEPVRKDPTGSFKKAVPATLERIFLVEDNDDNRDMLTRRLKRKGFDVLFAVNGRDALDRIPVEKPDLILMDISLPIVDGIEVSRRLKTSDATRKIPIIALTAHAMAGDRERALAAGCDEYDTKPVDFERLLSKIVQLLQKKS